MKVIGLCGGSGSGKSTVASLFLTYGIPSLNADDIYHELTSKDTACLREIAHLFGDGVILDGALNRRALAEIVFSADGEEKRRQLNHVTHRYVLEQIRERIRALSVEGVRAVLVDAPLLFESGFDAECDRIVCVIADRSTRIARLIARDGITEDEACRRINAQLSDEELMSRCDTVIENGASLACTEAQVRSMAQSILK